jgi:hypothetical protein
MRTAFQDYYRCPDTYGRFDAGELRSDEGYFKFYEAIGYGRLPGGPRTDQVDSLLPDVSDDVGASSGCVRLPFDHSEVVDNLRLERYAQKHQHYVDKITAGSLARAAYYFARPILPVAVRRHLQKVRLSGWESIPFPRWPVDFSVEALMRRTMALEMRARGIDSLPFIWFWPDGANGCGILTHDVEAEAGRDYCGHLMDLDDEHGIKASFQIVPERRYAASQPLCASMRARGFEVNVHDLNHDGRLFRDRKQFLARAAHINEYARQFQSRGFRSAAMYRNQAWLADLDFAYDMSVPNVAHLEPQRGGCCTVMPYFIGKMVELPLTTIQDYSLFHILSDYSIALWKTQIDLILAQHGLVTLLAHPDYLGEPRARKVYAQLLAHVRQLREQGALWMALPGDVECWWRRRHAMAVVREGDSWRIEGPGSERARLAYARIVDDEIVYEREGALCGVA